MVRRRQKGAEVVYVERGDSSAKWLFWGAVLGAGLALMYAPRSGEETRRALQRSLWKLRAMTEEKLDDLLQQYGPGRDAGAERLVEGEDEDDLEALDEDVEDLARAREARRPAPSAREELERRLADARARRRAAATEDEEPLA